VPRGAGRLVDLPAALDAEPRAEDVALVERYLAALAVEEGRSPLTIAAYRKDLRRYASWLALAHLGVLDAGPDEIEALAAEAPRVPRTLPRPLSEEEVLRLLEAPKGDGPIARRDRAILEVLYATGARVSELVGLDLDAVDLDAPVLRLCGKGARERLAPLGRPARQSLEAWLDAEGRAALLRCRRARRQEEPAVFLSARGQRITRQGVWEVVTGYGRKVGLEGRLSPHVLRHSTATHLLDHGADIRVVQELLGHASIATTQRYTLVAPGRLRQAFDAAHPRA
jgi:integrase/recombinase XerD